MKIGVIDAVIHFNEGANCRVKVLQSMGIVPGQNMRTSLRKTDTIRLCEAESKIQKLSKEANKNKKRLKTHADNVDLMCQTEYGPGMI